MGKMVNISRRTFLKTGATFGALAAMYPSRAWSQMPTFKIGFLPRVLGGAAIGLDKAGERHGVKIEIVPMPETTEAMIATARGSIHACNMTDLHVIRALDENLGVVQVSGLAGGWIEFVALSEVPVGYGDFAENITTRGLVLYEIPVGTKMRIGECYAEVTQIGKECHDRCAIYYAAGDCVMPREGIFVRVLSGGSIKKGDEIIVED